MPDFIGVKLDKERDEERDKEEFQESTLSDQGQVSSKKKRAPTALPPVFAPRGQIPRGRSSQERYPSREAGFQGGESAARQW